MTNYDKSQEKHSHFSDAEINREEDDFIRTYTERKGGAFKILALLYKTHIWKLLISSVFYAIKVSPTWIIPIITANLINLAVTKPDDLYAQITYNIIAAVLVLALNISFHKEMQSGRIQSKVMRDGVCVEFGTYKELMKKKGEFYTYKTMQS